MFVNDLAVTLYSEGRATCHHSEFIPMLRKRFAIDDAAQMNYLRSDVQTCTFLTKDSSGNYGFRHKSFMEFFVAKAIVEEVMKDAPHLLLRKILPSEIREFTVDFLRSVPLTALFKKWLENNPSDVFKENILVLVARLKLDLSQTGLGVNNTVDIKTQEATRLMGGDVSAFDDIFNRYSGLVKRVAQNYLGYGHQDVDDVVAQTFMRLW